MAHLPEADHPRHVPWCLTALLALMAVVLVGCVSSQQSPEEPSRYQDPQVGAARLMADSTPRVRDVVNVTNGYGDQDDSVVGAAVLIDSRVGVSAATNDTRRRPVFVVYASEGAARRAVAAHPSATSLRDGVRVIYLPPGFPDAARRAYEEGLGAALQ